MFEMYLACERPSIQMANKLVLLIKKWLKYYDLVTLLQEAHKSTQHSLVSPSRNGDFSLWVDSLPTEWRICFGYGFLESWPSLDL